MDNKQTIALAGLIKYEDSITYSGIPFLSKIPLVGALFRTKNIPGDTNTEMVIVLTPTVLTNKKFSDKEVTMPTPAERAAWDEAIGSKYPHEPLPSWPAAKAVPVALVAPVAAKAGPSEGLLHLPMMTAYARMVQIRISKAISYPNAAVWGRGIAGTVKLKLRILKNGALDSEEVIETSGNAILDQNAMQAAKTAAPFDAFTTGMGQEGLIFTIPIVYNNLISNDKAPAPAQKVIASY